MADWSLDYSDTENPKFIPNPADSKINGNIIVHYSDIGEIEETVYKFSDISNNEFYNISNMEKLFVDAESGNYQIKDIENLRKSIPDFENIPLDEIGRIT